MPERKLLRKLTSKESLIGLAKGIKILLLNI